ncbi:putative RNA-directed DNA polymerase [Helianthus anomalus]
MAEDGKVQIEKFDGKKFGWWKMQIEALLCRKDLDVVLEDERPKKMPQADWDRMDKKARAVIPLSISENVAFNIQKETSARGMMAALSNMYEKPSASNKVYLIRELVNTRMREGDSVTAHISNLNSILSRLVSVNIKFDDEVQALLLLSSLPDSWSGTVTAVTSSSDTSKFTFVKMRDLILGEDVRRRNSGGSSGDLMHVGRRRKNNRCSGSKNRKMSQ